jgi:hypothetical protein
MPTSETRTAMQIADLRTSLRRIKSNTSMLASSILRPMHRSSVKGFYKNILFDISELK